MTTEMELVVGCDGSVECIYDEALDLREIGRLQITRASHVERDAAGFSWADMGPVDGPVLGPFRSRTEAVAAERVRVAASPSIGLLISFSASSRRWSVDCAPPPTPSTAARRAVARWQISRRRLRGTWRQYDCSTGCNPQAAPPLCHHPHPA